MSVSLAELMSFGFHSLLRTYFSFYDELSITNSYQVDLKTFYFFHV